MVLSPPALPLYRGRDGERRSRKFGLVRLQVQEGPSVHEDEKGTPRNWEGRAKVRAPEDGDSVDCDGLVAAQNIHVTLFVQEIGC